MKKATAKYLTENFRSAVISGHGRSDVKEGFGLTDYETDYMFRLTETIYGKYEDQGIQDRFAPIEPVEESEPVPPFTRPPAVYSNRSREEVIEYYLKLK